jgi:hypothetical protein
VIFLEKEFENPKSSKVANEPIDINIFQRPTSCVGNKCKTNGNTIKPEAIRIDVATKFQTTSFLPICTFLSQL